MVHRKIIRKIEGMYKRVTFDYQYGSSVAGWRLGDSQGLRKVFLGALITRIENFAISEMNKIKGFKMSNQILILKK